MPKLTAAETEAFLTEPGHLVRIATVDADGRIRNVPIWYIFHDSKIVFTPRLHSVFLGNLQRDPRVGLTIDEEPLPYRKVAVQGVAEMLYEPGRDDEWRDLYRQIAYRYIPTEQADDYVTNTIDQPRALLGVPLSGEGTSTVTWRMPVDEEDPTGIWHRRYYIDGSIMARIADGGAP